MKSVRAVLSDVGGVITLPSHDHMTAMLRTVGCEVDPARLDRAHYAGVHALDNAHGVLAQRWPSYVTAYLAEAGVTEGRISAGATLLPDPSALSWTRECPGARVGMARIAAAGMPLAIVSNSDGNVARRLREHGLCQVGPGAGTRVLTVIDSGAVGIEKPDPRIFELALQTVGVGPGAAVYVGDSLLIDVAGAQSAGLEPLHMDPYAMCPDRDHQHVRSLEDVASRLLS